MHVRRKRSLALYCRRHVLSDTHPGVLEISDITGNYEILKLRRDGDLVRIEMARPERLNAVAMTGAHEMLDAARAIADDEDARMVASPEPAVRSPPAWTSRTSPPG